MTEQEIHFAQSLFDFGPLAGEYDRWYDTPLGRVHDRIQKNDVRHLLPSATSKQTLLDVGCGTGHWSTFFAKMGYRVTGVDVSRKMIDVARSNVPGGSFQTADVYDLPFADGTFDVTAAMATLEFLPRPAEALREMVRCTRLGGRLLIGTLNRLAPLNQRRLAENKPPYASAHLFSLDELSQLLAPWGRLRMAATSPEAGLKSRSWLKKIFNGLGTTRKKMDGPFIVAEVRL